MAYFHRIKPLYEIYKFNGRQNMNRKNESHRINCTRQADVHESQYLAKQDVNGDITHDDSFIEIKGREGSKTVFKKRIAFLEDVTDAEIQKLRGIAQRLPAIAFDALFDTDTIELMLNPKGEVWQEKLGVPMEKPICMMRESEADEFIRKIAGYLKTTITREKPWIEGVLPLDDSRFAAQIPPIVARPAFAIRRRAVRVFTLDEYAESGVMTAGQCENLRQAIRERQNVLVVGGTGSGKTTLGNAVLHEITVMEPNARQIIIEDTAELNSTAKNKVNYQTSPECSMTALLKITLRMRPDRIIVGEVRGAEAFDLVQAWNTGHGGGLATLHANDCASGLRRLKSLISQHPFAPRDIEPDIALAVNVMVNIVKSGTERRVQEIVAVREYDSSHRRNNGYHLEAL
jgi:type IV secretion system protein VirB11